MTEEQKAKIEVFANELVASEFKVDDDGYLRHIRSGCFNGNGLLEPISIDCLEEKIKAGAAYGIELEKILEREHNERSPMTMISKQLLDQLYEDRDKAKAEVDRLKAENNAQRGLCFIGIDGEQRLRLHEENQKLKAENEELRKDENCEWKKAAIAKFDEIDELEDENTKLRSLITEMGKALEYYFKGDEWDIGYKAKVALELKEKTLNEIDTNHGGGDSNG